jgi:hypothetical protein
MRACIVYSFAAIPIPAIKGTVSRDEYFVLMAYTDKSILSAYVLVVFKFSFVFIA